MNIFNTIALILGLLIVLVLIVFIIIKITTREQQKSSRIQEIENIQTQEASMKPHDFEGLIQIIKNKKSSSQDLQEALDMIIKYYGDISPKHGVRAHPDFDHYIEIIIRLCHHPKVTSKMVIKFDKELRAKNPEYEKDINDAITKGLDSRV
jgi:uncharacterized protein (UPF0335 family)